MRQAGRWRWARIVGVGAACLLAPVVTVGCDAGSVADGARVEAPGGVPARATDGRPFFGAVAVAERDDSVAPPMAAGREIDHARAAWDLVNGPWRAAMVARDAEALRRLLHDQFKGTLPGEDESMGPDLWAQRRTTGEEAVTDVKVLAPRLELKGGPLNFITIHFVEQVETEAGCLLADRIMNTRADDGGPTRVWHEQVANVRPCLTLARTELAAFHEGLRRTIGGPNPEQARLDVSSLVVWDYGVKVDEMDVGKLLGGGGGWVRERLLASEADDDTTTVLGETGLVALEGGGALLYEKRTGRWHLAGVLRGL